MRIHTNTNTAAMEQDLILVQNFCLQMEVREDMSFFRAVITSSVHVNNKSNNILIAGERPKQKLTDTN